MTFELECALKIEGVAAKDVWQLLSSARPEILRPDLVCDLYGSTYRVEEIASKIAAEKMQYFTVEFDNGYFHFSPLGSYGIALLQIARCIESSDDVSRWMGVLIALPAFIQGRLYDDEYEFWQNARDPLEYEARSQPYAHLPMRSNGLPPPLEQMEIDTSANPGRRRLQSGFIEAVGSPMWLSREFLKRVDVSESDLRSQDWLHAELLPSKVWKLSVQEFPFTSSEGEQARLQDKLRDFLFNADLGRESAR